MKKIIMLIAILNISLQIVAQTTTSTTQKATTSLSKWSLRADAYMPKSLASIVNASENGFHYPKDFGFSVGAERDLRNRKNTRIYQYGTLGFYNQVYFERVLTLATGLGFYRKIYKTVGTNFEFDVAYNRATSSHTASKLEGNKWVSIIDNSTITNRFVFSLGGNFEYSFAKNKKINFPLAITLGYNASILTPFDKKGKLPFNAYHQPRLGLKWKL
jgi:hypothetical protein